MRMISKYLKCIKNTLKIHKKPLKIQKVFSHLTSGINVGLNVIIIIAIIITITIIIAYIRETSSRVHCNLKVVRWIRCHVKLFKFPSKQYPIY